MSVSELNNDAFSPAMSFDWSATNAYRCHIGLCYEEGRWSAIVLNLPGVGSCGDTEDEALANVQEAAEGAILSFIESGDTIPWTDPTSDDIPEGAKLKWILVNVEPS
jgi:predicted RNase H-like HicB family nuclease